MKIILVMITKADFAKSSRPRYLWVLIPLCFRQVIFTLDKLFLQEIVYV